MAAPCEQIEHFEEVEYRMENIPLKNGGGRSIIMKRFGVEGFDQMLYDSVKAQEVLTKAVADIAESLSKVENFVNDKLEDRKVVKKWESKISVGIMFLMLILNFWFIMKEKVITYPAQTTQSEIKK